MRFHSILHPIDLRAGLIATGLKSLPKTVNKVRKMVVDYSFIEVLYQKQGIEKQTDQ